MKEPVFEIGIVMAGAISAGAYSAGVMDFIIEALDAYEDAKSKPGWDGPTHDVRIPVLAGASAGGMTSAICALHAFRGLDHVWPNAETRPPESDQNRLYSSWVKDIDIKPLLAATDLEGDKAKNGTKSALCCDVIDQIVEDAFKINRPLRQPNWVGRGEDRSLRVFMTLTNLRGVPYSFQFYGTNDPRRYGMLNHGDYLAFKIGVAPKAEPGLHALDIRDASKPEWDLYRTAAKATGAFPIGLAPRLIERPPLDYAASLRVGHDTPAGFVSTPPDNSIYGIDPYAFVSVDGGTIDNEPLEIARRELARGTGRAHNERKGERADRAVVLIAPFPNFQQTPQEDKRDGIVSIVPRLFLSALIQQARFKPDELALAEDDNVYSRYIISPEREGNANPASKKYPIACGVLGGFGGFLHESFRRHDYLLGRRNAQAFLRWNFALPENNKLFDNFDAQRRGEWYVRDHKPGADPASWPVKQYKTEEGMKPGLPIIPLTPELTKEIVIGPNYRPDPDYFADEDHWNDLLSRIDARASKVVGTLVDVDFGDMISGWFAFAKRLGAYHFGKEIVIKKAREEIRNAIEDVREAFFP
jgi:hypothetical protein